MSASLSGSSVPPAVVVVGASLGGLRTVSTLRGLGFEGRITLVGDEPHLPYDRPPLSKEVLTGEKEPADAFFRPSEYFEEQNIELRTGARAVGIDAGARTVRLAGGEELEYGAAVIATGARARTLPGAEGVPGVYVMRTLDDASAVRSSLETARRLVVVGAGFIGSEVAASARRRGVEVVVLEAADQPLAAAVGREVGRRCADLHGRYGADLRCGAGVAGVREAPGGGLAVDLSDGGEVGCDAVVVGIGVIPNVEWLEGSGVETERGAVVCDRYLRTSLPDVYAVGDLASWDNPRFGRRMRVEHWTNTVEQAVAAVRNIIAAAEGRDPSPYEGIPYFWSDQYGHRLQLVGLASDDAVFVDDPPGEPALLALYRDRDRLVGAFAIDRVSALMKLRRLLLEGASFDQALEFVSGL